MQRVLFFIACIVFGYSGNAQEVRLSYFGESLTHYGLKGAYAMPLYSAEKTSKREVLKIRSLHLAGGLAVYRHTQNHVGVILSPELSYHRQKQHGGFIEAGLSPALFKSFLEGTTYEVAEDGQLAKVPLAGRLAFMPSVFFGFGGHLSRSQASSLSWFGRINLMKQMPYNASSLTRFALEAGIRKPLR